MYEKKALPMNKELIITQMRLPLDKTKSYPQQLPPELGSWYCYPTDAGHSIVCVLKEHYRPDTDLTGYLIPVPVKSVKRGYTVQGEYVVVDLPYDSNVGLQTPPEDDEF